MHRRQVIAALGASGIALVYAGNCRASDTAVESIQTLLDAYVARGAVAGAVAVIGSRERVRFVCSGRIALESAAAPADPDSLWRVYSMTKLVTGAAAMALIEDRKLTLDTEVARIFPSFKDAVVLDDRTAAGTRRAKTAITVRHLMTHTSGLVGSLVPEPPLSDFYVDRKLNVSRVSAEAEANARHQDSLLAFASAAGTVPLAFEPGTGWSYGISSDVLGGVIEKVSGQPFERFLEARILAPLGMKDTDFVVRGAQIDRLSTNYLVTPDGLQLVDAPPGSLFTQPPPFPYPSSGLVSSARDFSRFAGMLLGEGTVGDTRILSTRVARLMMSNLLPTGVRAHGEGWGAGGQVFLGTAAKAGPLGRSRGTYGWEGAAGTTCWVDRSRGIFALLMTQYMPNRAHDLHADFAENVLAHRWM